MTKTVQVAIRLYAETAELAERIAKQATPIPVPVAAIYRAAIERGLEVLRRDMEAPKRKR